MYICKNCKKQVSDDSVFCQYCGTPVEQDLDQEMTVEEKEKTLESLSLTLKEASEAMIKEYVSNLKSMEVLLESTRKANQEKDLQIGQLKEQLTLREQMSSEYYNQLQSAKRELTTLQEKVQSLTAERNSLQEEKLAAQSATTPVLMTEEKGTLETNPLVCPNCKAEIDEETVFCPYCGKKIR